MASRLTATVKTKKKSARKTGLLLRWSLIVLLLVVLLVLGIYLFLCTRVPEGALLDHTYINDVDVSGMTPAEAEAALRSDFSDRYHNSSATVTLAGDAYAVPLWTEDGSILSLDPSAAIDEAMALGHGKFLTRGLDWLAAQAQGQKLTAVPAIQGGDALKAAIISTGIDQVDTAVETTYTVGESAITISKGSSGVVADLDAIEGQILTAFLSDPWAVTYTIDAATSVSDIAALDIQKIYDEVYTEPANATLDPENDYAIVPSVTGVSFDAEAAKAALEAAEEGGEITIDLVFTDPEIDTANLEEHLFQDTLGSYSTNVSGSSGRRSNVKLAAQFCDGTILLPGETFSYNGTVGQRTKARGFSEAPAYQNGQTIQEVGGGICQTSSTLYAACLYANLEITERHNHSFASSYIGLGMDATVSWGGPDYQFTNNTPYPIKVVGSYANGKVTMSIVGTKTDDITVKITSETLETIPYSVKTQHDSSLDDGETKVITTPYTGYKVQTYRKLYDGEGNLISSEPEAYSYYKARDKVIAQG